MAATAYDLFDFFKRTPDLVCIARKDGYFKQVNPAVIQKLGYSEEEIYGRPIFSFLHPDDRDKTRQMREKLLEGQTMLNFQNRYINKSGAIIWLEWTAVYVPEREVVFAIAKDITARKGIELEVEQEHLQFRGLASYLKDSMEKDRKFVATELHEELAQLMLALKLNVDYVRKEEPALSPNGLDRINQAYAIADRLIHTVRRISYSMSPHMIDDLGLNATLEWHCREFTVLHGIPCHFFTNLDSERMGKDMQIDLFRICQAALDNVRLHSDASSAKVKLESFPELLRLSVKDNGKGFDPTNTPLGLGLQTIYNRALSIGARVHLQSEPGNGTEVLMELEC